MRNSDLNGIQWYEPDNNLTVTRLLKNVLFITNRDMKLQYKRLILIKMFVIQRECLLSAACKNVYG